MAETHEFHEPANVPPAHNVLIEGPVSIYTAGFFGRPGDMGLGAKTWVRGYLQLADDEPMAQLRAYARRGDIDDGRRPRVIYDMTLVADVVERPGDEWLELWFTNGAVLRLQPDGRAAGAGAGALSDRAHWAAHLLRAAPRVRAKLASDVGAQHDVPHGVSSRQLRDEPLKSMRALAVLDPAVADIVGSHPAFAALQALPGTAAGAGAAEAAAARAAATAAATSAAAVAAASRSFAGDADARRVSPARAASAARTVTLPAASSPPAAQPAIPTAAFASDVAERVAAAGAPGLAETHEALAGLTAAVTALAAASDRTTERVSELTRLVQAQVAGDNRVAAQLASLDTRLDALGAAVFALTDRAAGAASAAELERVARTLKSVETLTLGISPRVVPAAPSPRAPTPAPAAPRAASPSRAADAALAAVREAQREAAATADAARVALASFDTAAAGGGGAGGGAGSDLVRSMREQVGALMKAIEARTGVDVSRAGTAAGAAARVPAHVRARADVAPLLARLKALDGALEGAIAAAGAPPRAASPARGYSPRR